MTVKPSIKNIPLVDLKAQYHAYKSEFDAALTACLERTSFVGGPDYTELQNGFAKWCGGGHVALVGNGTDALQLALFELLGQGDGTGEVITVSHTFIATAEAITAAGYKPVFVDIEADTYLMDLDKVETAINPNTRAIIPVHIYGQMVPMDRLMTIAKLHSLVVLEDAAQAHGASWKGKKPGEWGDAACFSFYPGKNLGAWGDAGAVFSRDKDLIERIRMRSNHGRVNKYLHDKEGMNSRLDGLQAAILMVKLGYIDKWNMVRRNIATWYDELLAGQETIQLPVKLDEAEHVFHLYVVQVPNRDRVQHTLKQFGVNTGVHYPVPLHQQPAYRYLGYKSDDLPRTTEAAQHVLSLPIYPELSREQAVRVANGLIAAVVPEER